MPRDAKAATATWHQIAKANLPADADRMAAGASGIGKQRGESLDPPVDGGVVHLNTALCQEFLDIAVGQRVWLRPHGRHGQPPAVAAFRSGAP